MGVSAEIGNALLVQPGDVSAKKLDGTIDSGCVHQLHDDGFIDVRDEAVGVAETCRVRSPVISTSDVAEYQRVTG